MTQKTDRTVMVRIESRYSDSDLFGPFQESKLRKWLHLYRFTDGGNNPNYLEMRCGMESAEAFLVPVHPDSNKKLHEVLQAIKGAWGEEGDDDEDDDWDD